MKIYFFLIHIVFYPLISYSQKVEIVKDSVCLLNECLTIQELNIIKPQIYNIIQTTFNLFDGTQIFTDYNERLKFKKKILQDCNSFNDLRMITYGFEDYEIYFNKNNLLNVSITLQAYGSPYETTEYLMFDLKEDKEIGIRLFKYKRQLFNWCLKKTTNLENTKFLQLNNYLSQYQLITNKEGDISNLEFIFRNPEDRTEVAVATFTYDEIKPFLKAKYLKYLNKR